jgi:4-amino-4-deoxy-L-arabinose transferase-like glycosyltransferase
LSQGWAATISWAPVEPRYAEIVGVMFAKGEWIAPTVNGDLYTDKPILYFWLALIASKIAGGVTGWTVLLWAALALSWQLILSPRFLQHER